jgi:hypothetical protein
VGSPADTLCSQGGIDGGGKGIRFCKGYSEGILFRVPRFSPNLLPVQPGYAFLLHNCIFLSKGPAKVRRIFFIIVLQIRDERYICRFMADNHRVHGISRNRMNALFLYPNRSKLKPDF